jgi:hypothetical protein
MLRKTTMLSFFILASIVSLSLADEPPAPTTQPAELLIDVDKVAYKIEEPVKLTIRLVNKSPKGVHVSRPGSEYEFKMTCDGQVVLETRFRKNALDEAIRGPFAGFAGYSVEGNETATIRLPLSRLMDLSTTGKYEIVVLQRIAEIGDETPTYLIQSNSTAFEIRE